MLAQTNAPLESRKLEVRRSALSTENSLWADVPVNQPMSMQNAKTPGETPHVAPDEEPGRFVRRRFIGQKDRQWSTCSRAKRQKEMVSVLA